MGVTLTTDSDVRGACYYGPMKVMTCISAITLFVSVGSLQSVGIWFVVDLLIGLSSLGVLFFTCARLGYFYVVPRNGRGSPTRSTR